MTKRNSFLDYLPYIFCLLFIISGTIVSVIRYWQYEVFYYDFGIFDRAIWEVSKFQAPIIDHLIVGGKWIFADHFSPSIFFLSPLYWFTDKSEILLVAQAGIVGLSGLVLYRIGLSITKNRIVSLSILSCYLLFVGLQNAIITDFHELTVMTLPLMLTFWAIVRKKAALYFIFLLVTLGFKETTFLLGIGIGIAILFINRKWLRIAIITMLLSGLWGLVSIKFIIPYFSKGVYLYSVSLNPGFWDKAYALVDSPIKQKTLFYSFFSFGFLPILSPSFWFLMLQDYLSRFITNFPARWDLGFHYNAESAVILAVACVFSFRMLLKSRYNRLANILALTLIINAFILHQFILHGPLALSYNKVFYSHTKDFVFLDKLIEKIPKKASIMTQSNLAAHFTHQKVWLLRFDYERYAPDYILIDMRKGQNANNYFGTERYWDIAPKLKRDSKYEIIHKSKEQYIFKRRSKPLLL